MNKSGRAPVITILDHHVCNRCGRNMEFAKANGQEDEMCLTHFIYERHAPSLTYS